ncbi:MAG: SIS domain-containing protein [Enterococcus sp.]
MFEQSTDTLEKLGASTTAREISQQPELWIETQALVAQAQTQLTDYFTKLSNAAGGKKIHVIFTGAGTSQYVGDTLVPYLTQHGDKQFIFHSFGTTDIVSSPLEYLFPDEPTLLVSFARSGNSPESTAAVKLADQIVNSLFHLTITCAADGQLAKNSQENPHNFLLLMPERANDAGFAMTGSFTCMLLSALLVFDTTTDELKNTFITEIAQIGQEILKKDQAINNLVAHDFSRLIYLGSGSLSGAAREAQLKILELTAGKVATLFDSSMGFRHGPKSFVTSQTLVVGLVSNNSYTRQYDLDVLEEVRTDEIALNVVAISQPGENMYSGENCLLPSTSFVIPDAYIALPMILVAQIISLATAIKLGNTPDTPSPSGTVNRVVKGVIIHKY